jgi:glutamate/tyrosine decarboxylase-like PLP-dependent enzyme
MKKLFKEQGLSWAAIEKELTDYRSNDADWKHGRVPLYVYHADDELAEVAKRAYLMYFSENALGLKAFPSLAKLESEVIHMMVEILNGDTEVVGNMSSGGTESIFLAVKTARDRARKLFPNITTPELVVPRTAHPAFNKAAHYLNLKVKRVRENTDFRANVSAMANSISDNTIMIVGSAPAFPHGVIDPIIDLGELSIEAGIWFHVDACVGGCLAPFVRKLGYPVPDFDFSVPGVISISADLHKYGFTAKPASTILYRNADYHKYQGFDFDEWPRGTYKAQTFPGTRPGGAFAAAWAVMKYLGEAGYLRIAERIMNVRRTMIKGIEAIPGLKIWGNPELSIICFGSDTIDMHAVGDVMEVHGWFVARNLEPPGLHHTLMPVHEIMLNDYLRDLAESVDQVMRGKVTARDKEITY